MQLVLGANGEMAQTYIVDLFKAFDLAPVRYSCRCVAEKPWLIAAIAEERLKIFGPVYGANRARARTSDGKTIWESP